MKLKRIIGLALAAVMSISSFSGLYITSSAAELASYIWDLTDCGEASGYVTPECGSARNNCTTLTVGEDVSTEYTKNIDRKSTRLNSSHPSSSRMPSSA